MRYLESAARIVRTGKRDIPYPLARVRQIAYAPGVKMWRDRIEVAELFPDLVLLGVKDASARLSKATTILIVIEAGSLKEIILR